ncbi:synergin gamma isoform X1 [Acyrthosiphon pisum]|uniref:EH domain-containing protein n=1 Tax=Acyrthosiphon pisum TaxID=7029 RepID=A0A8R2JPJ9_ACYPI|nr:synergin gamma isoform X1 [Acyrthosiphon pisum]XP_029343930.1 synergin gamma isoform X1 [Acyrthosiphon pisum]XP_029343931.1 synergin gamma isoform X1 [Acyrthosiphon pisum]XP_029343932.1 synergin gamma isoform X1 [Acyrthosiphon pisum]
MDKFHDTKSFASSSKNNSNEKSVDADSMIKNIISQDTFVVNKDHLLYSNLPKWMIPKSGFVHPLYEQIWQYVKSDRRDRTCDTHLVSQLLMTSGLPVDVLGGLWSMANVGVEGSLSQQELYIILALITLVQNGYSVSNVSLLQHIHKPIIPQLNYTIIEKKHNVSTLKSNIEHKPQQLANKASCILKINNEHQNIYAKNFRQPNCNIIPSEEYDPLAVTFIEPKNQMSKMMSPLSTNPEPTSLDFTPVNDSFETFDDEFSDFQCAQFTITDSKNNQEFTDFQSAFDTLSFKENTKIIDKTAKVLNDASADVVSSLLENQQNVITSQDDILDKYEVFRTLAAETDDVKNIINKNNHNDFLEVKPVECIKENIKNDVYDDEFGDFLCVEEVLSIKPDIEVDWKNVQVQCINKCLEFLLEGFTTFSSISDDKVLMEVINHDKGINYMTQLNLISQICQRILKSCYCPSLEDRLNDVLSKLETYLNNCTFKSTNTIEVLGSTKDFIPCYLCKCNCSTDSTEYMLNLYHSSCINLLMNFVQTSHLSVK